MCLNPELPADLVTFTEEILNGKLHFLCSVACYHVRRKAQRFVKLNNGNIKYITNIVWPKGSIDTINAF